MEFKELDLSNYGNTMSGFHIHINSIGNFSAQQPHYHDYFQIYYVLKGNITHHLLKHNTQLSYGDVFIIPPNYPHYISVNKKNTQFYSCSFTNEFVSSIITSNCEAGKFLFELLTKTKNDVLAKISIPIDVQLHLRNLLDFMLYEYVAKNNGYADILLSCTNSVLSIIARNYFSCNENNSILKFENEKQAIIWCIDYLNDNYTKNLTTDQVIKLSRMQRSDFCKQFKKISGYTFHSMQNKLRINKSIELITTCKTFPNMKTISEICGYSNFSTFYRNFVKYIGIHPTEYYKQHISSNSIVDE